MSIDEPGIGPPQRVDIGAGDRGHSRHSLQKVQERSLEYKQFGQETGELTNFRSGGHCLPFCAPPVHFN